MNHTHHKTILVTDDDPQNRLVAVEHLIVDIDCSQEFMVIELKVGGVIEGFLAVRTSVVVHEPAINTLHVEDVVAA